MTVHVPILVGPIVEALIEPFRNLPESAEPHVLVDFTLGGGGHTGAFLEALSAAKASPKHKVIAFDQDAEAIERAHKRFEREIAAGQLEVHLARFSETGAILAEKKVLAWLADLGFSSDQMDVAARGFSFQLEGPLDMRLDPSRGISCRDYLRQVTEQELEEVLREYGEERFSRRIASAVVQRRRERDLPETTKELASLVIGAIPASARHGRIHAATRTFQALRIAVNEELNELDWLLETGILFLVPGGRAAVISFHSLEDRKVKRVFRDPQSPVRALTKKPVEPGEEEIRENPRSRSAKLRIAERTLERA